MKKMINPKRQIVIADKDTERMIEYCNSTPIYSDSCKYCDFSKECEFFRDNYKSIPYGFEPVVEKVENIIIAIVITFMLLALTTILGIITG